MTPADRVRLAAEARAGVTRVIELLERPTLEALDQTAVELSTATRQIQRLKEHTEGAGLAVQSTLIELRSDLRRAGILLRRAWEFQAGISGLAGYTPTGELTANPGFRASWTLKG